MNGFKHLNLYERQRIEKYLRAGKSLRFIAGKLGRSVSSISDEIKFNSTRGVYNSKKAQHKAQVKRLRAKLQCMKVSMDSVLTKFIVNSMINDDQSP